ncbi:Multicopper oxidase LPR1 [Bienertia sinuspersici]
MAAIGAVNKYDPEWKKEWFGAGIFLEGSEEVEVDVFRKAEKRKLLSNVEKAGILSKAQGLGVTLSSIEKLGVLSKAEEFGLLSLLDKSASLSPSALASAALPLFVAAIAAVVLVPDDSFPLVIAQAAFSASLLLASASFFLASLLLDALQEEAD